MKPSKKLSDIISNKSLTTKDLMDYLNEEAQKEVVVKTKSIFSSNANRKKKPVVNLWEKKKK